MHIRQAARWVRADIGNGIVAGDAVFDSYVPVRIAGFTQEFEPYISGWVEIFTA